MSNLFSKIKSYFSVNSPIFILALSILAGIINYIFQVLAGRYCSPELFGQITVAISVIGVLTIPGVASMRANAVVVAGKEQNLARKYFFANIKPMSIKAIIPMIAISAASYLVLKSVPITILLFIVGIFMYTSYYQEGYIQGQKYPVITIIIDTIVACFRLFLGFLLLYLTHSIYSIPAYSLIGNTLVTIGLYIFIQKKFNCTNPCNENTVKEMVQEGQKNFYAAIVSIATLSLFQYIDIFSVKYFFNEALVGQYSAASLFGKMILYIPTAFITVMIPRVAAMNNKKAAVSEMHKTLLKTTVLNIITFTVLYFIKKPFIKIVMGEQYLDSLTMFIPTGLMTISFSLMNVMINYLISVRDRKFVSVSSVIAVLSGIVGVALIHPTVNAAIYVLALIYFITSVILFIRAHVKFNHSEVQNGI